ncbi:MAG: hypothetical protein H0T48_08795 [Gemmatimonadaceae bacterium]|nr:hypothetical protein [Gemmatimonadaceae bacterium]
MRAILPVLAAASLVSLSCISPPRRADHLSRFLYVWAGDKDEKHTDFMAVVDVNPASPDYGDVVATVPVGMSGSLPHHLEYELPPAGRTLYANGHHHEAVFLFDLERDGRPRLAGKADAAPPFRYPHDFARLPNGNVLVGYLRSEGPSPAAGDTTNPGGHGGIAEFTPEGRHVRSASAAGGASAGGGKPVRPYAFTLRADVDRVLVTSAAMMEPVNADVVQIFRLSDLSLLTTLPVPPARLPGGRTLSSGHKLPFGPRLMPDKSVLLNAYGCGFYRVTGIETEAPRIENVYTIDVPTSLVPDSTMAACGVPVVVGRFWVMSVGGLNTLIALDVSDPAHPVEVSRLKADSSFRPHWLAADPGSNRIIVGAENGGENRMLMARLDAKSGRLSWDESFRSADGRLGVSFVRDVWPHGPTGEAFGHAALFRR